MQEYMQHAYGPNPAAAGFWPPQHLPGMPVMPGYYHPDIAALSRQQQVIVPRSPLASARLESLLR